MSHESVLIQMARPYKKALATNSSDTSFPSRIPTVTEPAGNGVIDLVPPGAGGGTVPEWLIIVPYGLGTENDVFDLKVIGWRHIGAAPQGPTTNWLWIPTTITVLTCTLSTAVGVTQGAMLNTERLADTITLKTALSQPMVTNQDATPTTVYSGAGAVVTYSPADNTVAWCLIRLFGMEKVELCFDSVTGTPTMNALLSLM